MKTSEATVKQIGDFEGCKLTAYKCPAGVWTIGYGHTAGVYEGMKITKAQANQFLKEDLERFETHVMTFDRNYHWTQNEFDAMVSFAFNLGSINQLTKDGSRKKETIAEKMLLYVNAGGKELPGLVKRRKWEHDLFCRADNTPNAKPVTVKTPLDYANAVVDTLLGKYGSGVQRIATLTEAGFNPETVQEIVNMLYGMD